MKMSMVDHFHVCEAIILDRKSAVWFSMLRYVGMIFTTTLQVMKNYNLFPKTKGFFVTDGRTSSDVNRGFGVGVWMVV